MRSSLPCKNNFKSQYQLEIISREPKVLCSKFKNIKICLKIEIFNYIPIEQLIKNLFAVSKSLKKAVKKTFLLDNIFSDLEALTTAISFSNESIKKIKARFYGLKLSERELKSIFLLLLNLKFKTETSFSFEFDSIQMNINRKIVCDFLKSKKGISSLYIFCFLNYLDRDLYANLMFEPLQNNLFSNSLKVLNLYYNGLGKDVKDLEHLKSVLLNFPNLEELWLNANNIGKNRQDMKHLYVGLSNANNLRKLSLDQNYIGELYEDNVKYLQKIILKQNCKSIQYLSLVENFFYENEKNIEYLTEIIQSENINISYLNIESNHLGILPDDKYDSYETRELSKFFSALAKNKSIKELIIGNNLFAENEKNWNLFSNALTENQNLESLELFGENLLGNKFKIFAECLMINKSIKNLNMPNNYIGYLPHNKDIITKLLQENKNLKTVNFLGNGFFEQHKKEILELLDVKSKVKLEI